TVGVQCGPVAAGERVADGNGRAGARGDIDANLRSADGGAGQSGNADGAATRGRYSCARRRSDRTPRRDVHGCAAGGVGVDAVAARARDGDRTDEDGLVTAAGGDIDSVRTRACRLDRADADRYRAVVADHDNSGRIRTPGVHRSAADVDRARSLDIDAGRVIAAGVYDVEVDVDRT